MIFKFYKKNTNSQNKEYIKFKIKRNKKLQICKYK